MLSNPFLQSLGLFTYAHTITVDSKNANTETAKKPYGYQVNCHLKFGDSLHLKIKQTIKSEDEQESKKKQNEATA